MTLLTTVPIDAESASEPRRVAEAICPMANDRAVEDCAVAHGLSPREVRCLTGTEQNLAQFALAFERLRLQQVA